MNDYRRAVFRVIALFLPVAIAISVVRSRVEQPWSALLLVIGFVWLAWFFVTLSRIDRDRRS